MKLICKNCGKEWKHVNKRYQEGIGVYWLCGGGFGCGAKNKFPKPKKHHKRNR